MKPTLEPSVPSSGTEGQPELTIIDRREIPICGGIVVVETRSDGAMLVDGDLVEPVEITAEKMFNESKRKDSCSWKILGAQNGVKK